MKMHDGEVDIDARVVRRLVAAQFPRFGDLPVHAVRSTGTVNAIYRLGDRLCARLPRMREWEGDLEKEWLWLPRLAPHVTLRIPEPVERGRPDDAYPFAWAIFDWIEGRPYADDLVPDEHRAATDLARFVRELRRMETGDGVPRGGRRPLRDLDEATREAIAGSGGVVDAGAAAAAWERALDAPLWDGTPVWIHTDLLRPNLLVHDGSVSVIDFDDAGFSWYLYDLGTTVSFFEHEPVVPALVDSWLEGYRRAGRLSAADEAEIWTFIMFRRLLLVAWIGSHRAVDIAAELGAGYTQGSCDLAESYLSTH